MLLRMPHNSGSRVCKWTAAGHDIREFFIFITQLASFELTMNCGALYPFRKMTPIAGSRHGTLYSMRTGRQNVRSCSDQPAPRLEDKTKPAHRARLYDREAFFGVFPGMHDNIFR